jgi:hypothetical protein
MKVYLAGFIQGSRMEECISWRKKIREYYVMRSWDIEWLDPLNGKEINTISSDGLTSHIPPNAILHRDYKGVVSSDLIVVNMDTFGEERPLTGTMFELAWAWEHHIPIIMITTEQKFINHPFVKNFASMIFSSVDEMLEKKAINYMYKGMVNAEY